MSSDLIEAYARARATRDGLAAHMSCDPWLSEARFAVAFFEAHFGAEIASLREKLGDALAAEGRHRADCSVYSAPAEEPTPCLYGGWSDPALAWLYHQTERVADGMESGDTETGLLHEAMAKIELADIYVEKRRRASADTHPKDGDAKQAPFMSGAVAESETPNPSAETSNG